MKKGKYYVSAKVKNEVITPFIDTAADLSLIPPKWREYGLCKQMEKSMRIKSFDGQSTQKLEETLEIKMNFGTTKTKLKFYVCDIDTPIIGIDILRNEKMKISKTENLHINGVAIRTMTGVGSSEHALDERMEETENKTTKEKERNIWLKVKKETTIEAHQVSAVEVDNWT